MKTTPQPNQPKIAIISYSNRLRYTAYINQQAYANKHGYDYIFDISMEDEAEPFYYKLHKLSKFLPLYDFVLWMDDDAFFTDLERPLTEVFDMRSSLTIANSPKFSDTRWTAVNTGVMFFKNNPKTRQFIKDCLSGDRAAVKDNWQADKLGMYTGGDQDMVSYLIHYDKRYSQRFAKIVDYLVCNARPSDYGRQVREHFIVHFAGVPERDQAIATFADRYKLTQALLPKAYLKQEQALTFTTSDHAKLLRVQHKRHLLEKKYDAQARLLEQIFRRPLRFACGRLYHYYLKRDQKNAFKN